ncbi:PREDICTED: helicase SRCAP-like [Calidris pugnax]|uniref:helicase SRCAP-like n=1 Tax=Calidris pugnax TaxID=198806 RepID=UPI00071E48C5|nr:PREDICTED: helicase SRCAP-like [Calidris pugnax]
MSPCPWKLQTLDVLLRRLKAGAHRVLIFTQMTRMLDVLERFLTYHGHIYLRLDGSTRVEQRQWGVTPLLPCGGVPPGDAGVPPVSPPPGKLQTLDVLLRRLKAGAHRVLIFTQMTRMLDVLERFLTYHGHIYLRLDGSTRVEQRQALMERFNADKRIFCFILSTRSGGVGVNLAGADTVIFYDSDWNPTMDAQAQDRCHRIGQTRDVHIYRLISERTVEENILKKANQKRMLGDMAIEGGNFTTAYFKQQTIRELFDMAPEEPGRREPERDKERDGDVPNEEDEDPVATRRTHILEQALCGAEDPEDIRAASQAQAERVAAMAEFSESLSPEEERGGPEPEEELSKAEQEIAALVEQVGTQALCGAEDPEDIRAASQAQAERVAAMAEFSESLSPEEERGGPEPEEELSKAEQEIAALVEQLTPIERYAMNFLEASLEDISREELKQAEVWGGGRYGVGGTPQGGRPDLAGGSGGHKMAGKQLRGASTKWLTAG